MFVHLNTHSVYSKMSGLLSLHDLVELTAKSSMDKIALTDTNGLWGFIRFVQHARNRGLGPIAGVNLITKMDELIVLVENQSGYENLCRIISDVHRNLDKPIIELIRDRSIGLFFFI